MAGRGARWGEEWVALGNSLEVTVKTSEISQSEMAGSFEKILNRRKMHSFILALAVVWRWTWGQGVMRAPRQTRVQ
jgi:hypothetical protein